MIFFIFKSFFAKLHIQLIEQKVVIGSFLCVSSFYLSVKKNYMKAESVVKNTSISFALVIFASICAF